MNKPLSFIALFFLVGAISCNQFTKKSEPIAAITNKGVVVMLNEDGTWEFADKVSQGNKQKINNTDSLLRVLNNANTGNSSSVVKSAKTNIEVNINPDKWTVKKEDAGEAAEYSFALKGNDAYGMLITERIAMPLDALKKAALANAASAAPDIKVVDEEIKNIGGEKVLFMQMDGTISGVKFSYLGYYYSSDKGTVQFITYTSQNLLKENRKDMEDLLNQMVILK